MPLNVSVTSNVTGIRTLNEQDRARLIGSSFAVRRGFRLLSLNNVVVNLCLRFGWNRMTENKLASLNLNERQMEAVKLVKEKGKITNKEYSDLTNVNSRTALRDLNGLCDKKVFEKRGVTGRNTQYVLTRHKPDKRDMK